LASKVSVVRRGCVPEWHVDKSASQILFSGIFRGFSWGCHTALNWRSIKNCLTQLGRSSAFIFCCYAGKLVQGDKQLLRRRHRKNVVQNGATTQLAVHPLTDTHTCSRERHTDTHPYSQARHGCWSIFRAHGTYEWQHSVQRCFNEFGELQNIEPLIYRSLEMRKSTICIYIFLWKLNVLQNVACIICMHIF